MGCAGYGRAVPRKIRELIADLKKAGFVNRGGKGAYRNFEKEGCTTVTISGKEGVDAHRYQERDVQKALNQAQKQI